MTKDTEEFSQFTESGACREYTLPRDENLSEPKGWIRGNTKIGPVLEVTTSYLHGSKNMRYNWRWKIFRADQKPKQNHREENLLALHQE